MKIFIPTKGRPVRISTHKYFPSAYVVVHNEQEAEQYRANATIDPKRILISGAKTDAFGLTRQREWVCQTQAKKNEWILFADDNIYYLLAMDKEHYGFPEVLLTADHTRLSEEEKATARKEGAIWRPRFNTRVPVERFLREIVPDTVSHCEIIGAHLAGFSLTDNILFRRKKFVDVGYVIGKLMLWHNTGHVPFDHTVTMEDFYHTAENLKRYGVCVVNNFVAVRPTNCHYLPGGMGTYDERVPYRKRDVETLLARYPGMLAVKDREGFVPGTDLRLLLHSREDVQRWQRAQKRTRLF